MTRRRRKKRRSSRSWSLPPSERRELYISRNLSPAADLFEAHAIAAGADSISVEWRTELETLLHRVMTGSWADGAENEADLRTARDAERLMRLRMEQILREHGIEVPTDPRPSDPPAS